MYFETRDDQLFRHAKLRQRRLILGLEQRSRSPAHLRARRFLPPADFSLRALAGPFAVLASLLSSLTCSMVKLLRGHRTSKPPHRRAGVGPLPWRSCRARRSQPPLQAVIVAGNVPGFHDDVGRYFKSEKHSPCPHASAFRTALTLGNAPQ